MRKGGSKLKSDRDERVAHSLADSGVVCRRPVLAAGFLSRFVVGLALLRRRLPASGRLAWGKTFSAIRKACLLVSPTTTTTRRERECIGILARLEAGERRIMKSPSRKTLLFLLLLLLLRRSPPPSSSLGGQIHLFGAFARVLHSFARRGIAAATAAILQVNLSAAAAAALTLVHCCCATGDRNGGARFRRAALQAELLLESSAPALDSGAQNKSSAPQRRWLRPRPRRSNEWRPTFGLAAE